jgi:fructan beta-fructosidase
VTFDPSLRPVAHFTPARNWLNDPNGLVWYDGEYHLFFQHNPEGTSWGNMSWGHAVSPDLVSWTELPLALRYCDHEHVFSGCVVVDHANTSGLGTDEHPAMVAVYTSHDPAGRLQAQSLAFSLDRGRTWERYAGNPVLDIGSSEFRDPKVFRYDDQWVMVVSLADKRMVRFYGSPDLVHWEQLSDLGPFGSVEGVWECPDLIQVPIEDSDRTVWALLVSVGAGHPAGGSGMQYVLGDFDGSTFTPDAEARWLDHGADFYAAISYADAPGDEPVIQGWMSNWAYAREVPAAGFRGSVTLPRRLSARHRGGEPRLVQQAVAAEAAGPSYTLRGVPLVGRLDVPGGPRAARLVAEIDVQAATRVGLEVRVGDTERTVIAVDPATATLSLDRCRSGDSDFHAGFAAAHSVSDPAVVAGGVVRLEVYVDVASVEVFAADGEVVLTDQVFPSPDSTGLAVFADGGPAVLRCLEVTPLG